MSKRRRSSQRDTTDIANHHFSPDRLLDVDPVLRLDPFTDPRLNLRDPVFPLRPRVVDPRRDLRFFHPVRTRDPLKRPRSQVPFRGLTASAPRHLPWTGKRERDSVVCERRSVREQVLHALGRTGRGSGGGRKRITPDSKIRCRKRR